MGLLAGDEPSKNFLRAEQNGSYHALWISHDYDVKGRAHGLLPLQ
jgi:hypothetical protein